MTPINTPAPTSPNLKPNARRWFDAGVFALFFVLFLHAVEDPDIWFHMAIGRAVLEQGAVPAQEFYVFTRLGQAAEFHEWGFGLLYHLIYQAGGLAGMVLANALFGALTVFLLYRIACRRGVTPLLALTAATAGLWLLEFRFVQRPEDFLYLALAATLYCVDRYRAKGDWRQLLPIPLIGLLLAQLHPSVFMLGLVLGTFVAEAVLRRAPDLKRAAQLSAIIVATLGLSVLNPYGIEQLILPLKFATETDLLNDIAEFLPALSTEYAPRFVIGVALGVFALVGIRRRFSLAEWLMLAAFAGLAFQHVRNIALLGLALVLPLATALEVVVKRRGQQMALAALCLLLVVAGILPRHRLSLDIEPSAAPVAAAEIIATQTRGGNILNFYHLGNYLAWRLSGTHRVLIDGRNFRSNAALDLHDRLLLATRGWQRTLDRYAIVAVVTPATLPYSGDFIPLAQVLAQTPGWRLAGRETAGLLFLRDEVRGRSPAARCAAQREVWLQAKEELDEGLLDYPNSATIQKSLVVTQARLAALDSCGVGRVTGR